ncbi:MAG: penicillin-binding protein 2 [Herpetosiphon sp.]
MAQVATTQPHGISRTRINVVLLVCVLLSLLTTRKLVTIQVIKQANGHDLAARAEQELTKYVVLQPRRGTITDRNGIVLAMNVDRDSLYIDPTAVKEPEKLSILLAPILGQSAADLLPKLSNKNREWDRLARWIEPAAADQIRKLGDKGELPPGFFLLPEAKRVYPQGTFASQIVGLANYEGTGISGIEGYYDSEIKGITGTLQAEQDASQQPIWIAPHQIQQPQDGMNVKLTLDSTVQKVAEDTLKEAINQHHADGGSVVVMNPDTGEILGMASWPTFDPNNYVDLDPAVYNHNPAMNNVYEPGSTFKVLLTAMGLQSKAFTPNSTVSDVGAIQRYGWSIHNWNSAGIGATTPETMLYRSSNVAALQFGEMVGKDRFYQFVKAFGYGQPTNIDLAGEEGGIVNWPIGDKWSLLTLDQNSFGQGIAVTPLQHLTAISAVANGGNLMLPHLRREFCNGTSSCQQVAPTVVRHVLDQEATDQIRDMLVKNANQYAQVVWGPRTGRYKDMPLVPGYRVCAKTGTSQIAVNGGYDSNATIGSVVGWAPAEHPRISVLVKIDRPKDDPYGVSVAIPVYQKVVSQLLPYYGVAPDPKLMDPLQAKVLNLTPPAN